MSIRVLHRVCRLEVWDGGLDRVAGPRGRAVGIRTMLVEPGFFRTELLTPESTNYAEPSIDDYAAAVFLALADRYSEMFLNL